VQLINWSVDLRDTV